MSEYEPKLVHLPGTKLTPEVVLHRTLAKLDHIASVVVVIQWKDETFDTDWSQQKLSALCMGSMLLQHIVAETITGQNPDKIFTPSPGAAS